MSPRKKRVTACCALVWATLPSGCGSDDPGDPGGDAAPHAGLRSCFQNAGLNIASTVQELPKTELGVNAESEAAAQVGDLAVYEIAPTNNEKSRVFFAKPDGGQSLSREQIVARNDDRHFVACSNDADASEVRAGEKCMESAAAEPTLNP